MAGGHHSGTSHIPLEGLFYVNFFSANPLSLPFSGPIYSQWHLTLEYNFPNISYTGNYLFPATGCFPADLGGKTHMRWAGLGSMPLPARNKCRLLQPCPPHTFRQSLFPLSGTGTAAMKLPALAHTRMVYASHRTQKNYGLSSNGYQGVFGALRLSTELERLKPDSTTKNVVLLCQHISFFWLGLFLAWPLFQTCCTSQFSTPLNCHA